MDPIIIIGSIVVVSGLLIMVVCFVLFWQSKSCRRVVGCIKINEDGWSETESLDDGYDNIRIDADQNSAKKSRVNSTIGLKSQINLLTYDKKREIPRSSFTITKQIGSGNFGTVSRGELTGLHGKDSKTTVAIKSTKGPAKGVELRDFLQEIKIMSHIRPHLNLVSMIGSCASELNNQKEMWLIIEFCHHGELKSFLIENKKQILSGIENESINSRCLLHWTHDIAKGMEFLSSQKIMHGDLAARNIMLDDNPIQPGRLVAKVADFGLSKQFYGNVHEYEKENRVYVPWKWMAFEYLTSEYFTMTSDVWSFGIVLWEIFSCGRTPYGNQDYNDVLTLLEGGYRLPCPLDIKNVTTWKPEELYNELSNMCFKEDPKERKTFSSVVESIEDRLTGAEMLSYANMENKYQSEYSSNYLRFGKSKL